MSEAPREPAGRLPPALRGLAIVLVLVASYVLVQVLNQPRTDRLRAAREALAEAGYPGARLSRSQITSQMVRCEVGQIRNRGYAYAWSNDRHSELYCLRLDGRPNRIIVD